MASPRSRHRPWWRPDGGEVVRGAFEVAGASVPLVGGCAGDAMAMRSTSQIFGARVLNQAVVAAAAPIGMLLFDCVARRSVLESASADGEFECVQELLGPLPVAGFYTYGEIARNMVPVDSTTRPGGPGLKRFRGSCARREAGERGAPAQVGSRSGSKAPCTPSPRQGVSRVISRKAGREATAESRKNLSQPTPSARKPAGPESTERLRA